MTPVPFNDMEDFWHRRNNWSELTFGNPADRGPEGPLKHLRKEVSEGLDKPTDLMEYVDMLFLVFDAAWRAGFSYHDLLHGAFAKLAINKKRKWGTPTKDGIVEHVR